MTVKDPAYVRVIEGMKFHRNSEFPLMQTVIILYVALYDLKRDSF